MYTVILDGRRWDGYPNRASAERIRKTLLELFPSAAVQIYGPRGGRY